MNIYNTLCDSELLWLGDDKCVAEGTCPAVTKPLLMDVELQGNLGVVTGAPGGWKWLLGVDGREFVGVRHVTDWDSLWWTIFWHAEKQKC